jgi:hypothetical protein
MWIQEDNRLGVPWHNHGLIGVEVSSGDEVHKIHVHHLIYTGMSGFTKSKANHALHTLRSGVDFFPWHPLEHDRHHHERSYSNSCNTLSY